MANKKNVAKSLEGTLATKQLQQIANCLAYLVVNTGSLKDKSKGDIMLVLAAFGYDRSLIACILDTSPESVSARISQLKAEAKMKKTNTIATVE